MSTALTRLRKKYKEHPLKINEKTPPFRVLVSTLLSARTKDPVTVEATKRLFSRISTPKELLELKEEEIEKIIYPVGFYKTKAKHLREMAQVLISEFKGKVPETLEELTKLPGVGRKTANLILSVAFGKPAICVDTHVHRISNRLGWVSSKDVLDTEEQLMKVVPKKDWRTLNLVLVNLGQNICQPVSPKCGECFLSDLCPKIGVTKSR